MSGNGLAVVVGMGAGKMETGIPWWAIFAGAIIFACAFGVFQAHERKGDAPATVDAIKDAFAANSLELQSIRAAAEELDMEPFGDSGITSARLPDRTTLVRLPDGSFRLAMPRRAEYRITVTAGSYTVEKISDKVSRTSSAGV